MPPLADVQRRLRDAVVAGGDAEVVGLLAGAKDVRSRLAIHQRHYETSLSAVVRGRFQATAWLIGPRVLETAARLFVRAHPPLAPCVAEYGAAFPAFLADVAEADHIPYLRAFAEIDWQLGRLAVSADIEPVDRTTFGRIAPEDLSGSTLRLQDGVWYLRAAWALDELVRLFLSGETPERWVLEETELHLEFRGSRGAFRFARLSAGDFEFRHRLAAGQTLEDAALEALAADRSFDPGVAMLNLVDSGLVTAIARPDVRSAS